MKNKNFLPALTLFAFVWILGFVVFKVLLHMGASWWWILLPLPVGAVLIIAFQVNKDFIRGRIQLPALTTIAAFLMVIYGLFWFAVLGGPGELSTSAYTSMWVGNPLAFVPVILLFIPAVLLLILKKRWVWWFALIGSTLTLCFISSLLLLFDSKRYWRTTAALKPDSTTSEMKWLQNWPAVLLLALLIGGLVVIWAFVRVWAGDLIEYVHGGWDYWGPSAMSIILCIWSIAVLLRRTQAMPWRSKKFLTSRPAILSLLVVIVLGVSFGVLVMPFAGDTDHVMYNTGAFYARGRWAMEDAIGSYKNTHNQEVPIVNDTPVAVNGSEVVQSDSYYIVAMCPLLALNKQGDSMWFRATEMCHAENCAAGGDNLDGCTGCNGSYLWLTTISGDVASICIGAGCEAHGEDGFQGVYP